MLLLTALLFTEIWSNVPTSLALPASKSDTGRVTNGTVGWVKNPDGRGTLDLVLSCILTLSLCVWSAMHLNVPAPHEPDNHHYLRLLKWGITGLFAPELVVFAAWRQWNSARTLGIKMQELFESDEEDSSSDQTALPLRHPWTMVHGFYAGMGGYAFGHNARSAEFLPDGDSAAMTLTTHGVLLLAQCGHLPNIRRAEIADKSKADGIAKSLVCLQALWMLAQVASRLAQHLTVTLLEVNTIGHVFCALVIYLLWWNKPREVNQAFLLEGEWVAPLHAFMTMSSRDSFLHKFRPHPIGAEADSLVYFPPSPEKYGATATSWELEDPEWPHVRLGIARSTPLSKPIENNEARCGHFRSKKLTEGDTRIASDSEADHSLRTKSIARHRLAAEAIRAYPAIRNRLKLISGSPTFKIVGGWYSEDGIGGLQIPTKDQLVIHRSRNWPGEDLMRGMPGAVMGLVLWFASIVYGGVHAAAWNEYFPTYAEKLMWRMSAVYIACSGVVWVTINGLAHLFKWFDAHWDMLLARKGHWLEVTVLLFLCTVCGVMYIFARVYLVVESFVSLRELPPDSYLTPGWFEQIPHL